MEEFSRSLFRKLRIDELLEHPPARAMHLDGDIFRQVMAAIWQAFGLSLRDIEQMASLINTAVRVMSEEQNRFIAAWEVGAISALRLKYPELYDDFISGKRQASYVVNEIEPLFANQRYDAEILAFVEAYFYIIESADYDRHHDSTRAFLEMYRRREIPDAERSIYFSNRVNEAARKGSDSDGWANPRILSDINRWMEDFGYGSGLQKPKTIAGLLDLQPELGAN